MSNPTIKEVKKTVDGIVNDALNEYRLSRQGTALSFIRLARKLAASGISKTRALQIVANSFPAEAKAYHDAEQRGDKLPILFPKDGPSYEEKRKLALQRGGIIG